MKHYLEFVSETKDPVKKAKFRDKATEYMNRAEALQKTIDSAKAEGRFHEQIHISENSIGNSYEKLFGQFFDCDVTSIHMGRYMPLEITYILCLDVLISELIFFSKIPYHHPEDPYIRAHHQITNFLRFVELAVKKCTNLRTINLVTKYDQSEQAKQEQLQKFREIAEELKDHHIVCNFKFSDSLHDRQIK